MAGFGNVTNVAIGVVCAEKAVLLAMFLVNATHDVHARKR